MIRIVTDTTACLPADVAKRYDIPVLPQIVCFGTESFREGLDIDHATFLQRLTAAADLPKTAAPPPRLFVEVFERLVPSGASILCIHPSAEVSGTVRAATAAAAEFADADIRVLDTRVAGSPMGSMVSQAAAWAAQGIDADKIEMRLRDSIERCRVYFMVDTLEFLQRGGRIGGAAALLGSVLRIKPILTFRDGRVEQLERERTTSRALARLTGLARDSCPPGPEGRLTVMHASALQRAERVADDLRQLLGLADVPVMDAPPAIVTHAGPGLVGLGFFVAPGNLPSEGDNDARSTG